jgi:hypothetical protein
MNKGNKKKIENEREKSKEKEKMKEIASIMAGMWHL